MLRDVSYLVMRELNSVAFFFGLPERLVFPVCVSVSVCVCTSRICAAVQVVVSTAVEEKHHRMKVEVVN